MPRSREFSCKICGRSFTSVRENLAINDHVCSECCRRKEAFENGGGGEGVFELLRKTFGYNCIIPNCRYQHKHPEKTLHIHRILKGRNGGGYAFDNCVFVCAYHHRMVEGKSRGALVHNFSTYYRGDPLKGTEQGFTHVNLPESSTEAIQKLLESAIDWREKQELKNPVQ